MDRGHQAVLLEEAIANLMVSTDGAYVDGTFGRGGHSTRILDALSPLGTLLALDQDPAAAEAARHLSERDARFRFQACNFRSLSEHAAISPLTTAPACSPDQPVRRAFQALRSLAAQVGRERGRCYQAVGHWHSRAPNVGSA